MASLTVPNLITLIRILLTPLFIIFLIQGRYQRALLVFVLAGVSDLVDGLIARGWQQRSRLGSYLDPLADKLLLGASFVTLAIYHQIPSWVTVVVLSRDVFLTLGVLVLRLSDYPLVIKPSVAAKLTTNTQLATVLLVLLAKVWPLPAALLQAFFWLTAGVTVVSGIHYVYGGLRMVSQAGSSGQGGARG